MMGLLANIRDPDYVTRHIDFTNWFEWTQDLPGAFYLWIIEHLFVHNELARGVLVVGGRPVDLSAIECPIFLLAGTKDHITPPEQVWALGDLVSTPAQHIARELVDAGHLGLFMAAATSSSVASAAPSATLPATVPATSVGRCGIHAMWASQLCRSTSAIEMSSAQTVPALGSTKPSITPSNVDLPQPLGPTMFKSKRSKTRP